MHVMLKQIEYKPPRPQSVSEKRSLGLSDRFCMFDYY